MECRQADGHQTAVALHELPAQAGHERLIPDETRKAIALVHQQNAAKAARRRAFSWATPEAAAPVSTHSDPAKAGAVGTNCPPSTTATAEPTANHTEAPMLLEKDGSDHHHADTQSCAVATASPKRSREAAPVDADQPHIAPQSGNVGIDTRFSDPLVSEIVQMHRMWRRWLKARNALILQGKAIGRAFADGDKDEGTAAFTRVSKGKATDADFELEMALLPFIPAIERFDAEIAKIEKSLVKLAKRLPIAPWVDGIRGFGFASLAHLVGEAGDISQYRTVSGLWKRCGLAVIDGERQRKCSDAEKALEHGYSPERRSIVWNIAEPLARLQRTWVDKETGEIKKPADPYGAFMEAEKARQLELGQKPVVAEARAKRHMMKRILRDMFVEWRRVTGAGGAMVAPNPTWLTPHQQLAA